MLTVLWCYAVDALKKKILYDILFFLKYTPPHHSDVNWPDRTQCFFLVCLIGTALGRAAQHSPNTSGVNGQLCVVHTMRKSYKKIPLLE